MAKINIKLNDKNIFKVLYGTALLTNIIALFFLYMFLSKNVYETMITDSSAVSGEININFKNLDVDKFNKIIAEISKKKKGYGMEINNFFH